MGVNMLCLFKDGFSRRLSNFLIYLKEKCQVLICRLILIGYILPRLAYFNKNVAFLSKCLFLNKLHDFLVTNRVRIVWKCKIYTFQSVFR